MIRHVNNSIFHYCFCPLEHPVFFYLKIFLVNSARILIILIDIFLSFFVSFTNQILLVIFNVEISKTVEGADVSQTADVDTQENEKEAE